VRKELCQFLIDRGDIADAQPEVLALAQEAPAGDLERGKESGAFLLRTGLWARALQDFQAVLKQSRADQDALVGAAVASYQLNKYAQALDYFDRLHHNTPLAGSAEGMLQTSRDVELADPFRRGLSPEQRAMRTGAAIAAASSRVTDCAHERGEALSQTPPATELQKLYATGQSMKKDWSELNLSRHPDRSEAAMSLVFQMEGVAAQQCGEPREGPDRILRLLERGREGTIP